MIRTRIALTPSGHLFLGGARVALAIALHAHRHNGTLILRVDDLDSERCKPAFVDSMQRDLSWFGVVWQQCVLQSERSDLYQSAIQRLKDTGRLYPCFESDVELRAKADHNRKRGKPTIYDRAMLRMTDAQREAAEAGGKRPYWRFRLSDGVVAWQDLVAGPRDAKLPSISDPILVKSDGTPTAMLASVVDDIELGITHVIHGMDSVANVGAQLDIRAALRRNAVQMTFAQVPATEDTEARAMRRFASQTVRAARGDGFLPSVLAAYLIRDGLPANIAAAPLSELAARFQLNRMRAVPSDTETLLRMNREALATQPFQAVAEALPSGATEAFWLAIRTDIDQLTEARHWWEVVAETIVPPVIDQEQDVLAQAASLLPDEPWDNGTGAHWIEAVSAATGRDQATIMDVLRLALTGEDHGPDLGNLLPLIGHARAADRLRLAGVQEHPAR